MDIVATVNEYKAKIEALAGKAAEAEDLAAKLTAIEAEKASLEASLTEKDAALLSLNEKASALEAENTALKADIETREANKKASDEKALEIVASLGLKEIPVVTITESSAPSAEDIRAKYLAIADPTEKGKYFAEHRNAILNGVLD